MTGVGGTESSTTRQAGDGVEVHQVDGHGAV